MTTREETQKQLIELAVELDTYTGDKLDTLGRVRLIELACATLRRALVREARDNHTTWREIGDALGVSAQAAHERFGQDGALPIKSYPQGA